MDGLLGLDSEGSPRRRPGRLSPKTAAGNVAAAALEVPTAWSCFSSSRVRRWERREPAGPSRLFRQRRRTASRRWASSGRCAARSAASRIPAATAADLHAYVDKLAAYESDPGGAWTGQALLAAGPADIGGDFPATSDTLAGLLAPGLGLTRVYLPGSPGPAQVQASRSQLQAALRQGQVLFNYVGHGGLDRLTSEGLLTTSDAAQLGNAPRVPVMTALTCLISQFAYPSVSSLGEDLVLQGNGGTAALFGPTWLSHNGPAGDLGRYLLPQLAAPGGGRLGDRLLRGLAAYAAAGGDRETLRVYTLLGDPALALKR